MPNLDSAWPVAIDGWVPASTAGITRSSTSCTTPVRAGDLVEPVELRGVVDDHQGDAGLHGGLRARTSDLLLPCITTRDPGIPARSAASSSPPVATSRSRPSSTAIRMTACVVNAFTA